MRYRWLVGADGIRPVHTGSYLHLGWPSRVKKHGMGEGMS